MMAIDSSHVHGFGFTPAISFMVNCGDQPEIDRFWDALAEGGGIEECGWLHDQFGISWQVVPAEMEKWIDAADPEQSERVMEAVISMKKLDIAQIKKAAEKPARV
jgi:predicted 3-demethylubiquinone-9 3-methyltransferase (glyoxalase superfamily)